MLSERLAWKCGWLMEAGALMRFVDPLLGCETRPHEDLDLVVALDRSDGSRKCSDGEVSRWQRISYSFASFSSIHSSATWSSPPSPLIRKEAACNLSRAEGRSGTHRRDLSRAASLAGRWAAYPPRSKFYD